MALVREGQAGLSQTVAERVQTAMMAAGQGFEWMRRRAGWPLSLVDLVDVGAPDRLVIAPQDIRTADPTMAADIYAGYFAFAGKMVNTHGASPFEVPPPSPAWAANLAGFGWLRHLRAADTALARANGRVLVEDWIANCGRPSNTCDWEPRVIARRLLSWLSQSPLILEGADRQFYGRFMKNISRQASILQRRLNEGPAGETRLLVLIALSEFSLCADGLSGLQTRMSRLLGEELERQILADGGHIARNPQIIIDLLLDMLPLRQAYAARGVGAPPQLLNAIDRMMPMLRLFRLGDGSIALFNGMGATAPHDLATILAYDDARSAPLSNAPASGYQRLETGPAVLILDAGVAPPAEYSTRAHAGCLSFEFSFEAQRLIVNCGSPIESRLDLRDMARSTAAHSTLTMADTSSCQYAKGAGLNRLLEGRIISGPSKVTINRQSAEDCIAIEASHDGYERQFGVVHTRSLFLSTDGERLEGEDTIADSGRKVTSALLARYAIRFHLHPSVRARLREDRQAVELSTPSGQVWTFESEGYEIDLEESIYFAGSHGLGKTEQLVIHASRRDEGPIGWSLGKTSAE